MPLVALFKCAMVTLSSTLRPCAYPEPAPEPNGWFCRKVRKRRFGLDKWPALANNHAALNQSHGIYFNQRQASLFLDLPTNIMAVGCAVRVDLGFYISDSEKLV